MLVNKEKNHNFLQNQGLYCMRQLWFYFKLWNYVPQQNLENFYFSKIQKVQKEIKLHF